jgi:hypothetical protein
MPHRAKKLTIWMAIGICALGAFLWHAHTNHRGFAGHTLRWFQGESGAMQEANDLAEDLRTVPDLAALQPWAVTMLQRFHRGEVLTNAAPRFSNLAGYHLTSSEIPEFIAKRWSGTNAWGEPDPEISIFTSSNTQPDVVTIHWRQYEVVVGPTNFVMPSDQLFLCVKAKPGVYVYADFR